MGPPDASVAYCVTTRLCFGKTRTSSASTKTRCVDVACTGQPEASWVIVSMRDAIPVTVDSSMTPYLQHLRLHADADQPAGLIPHALSRGCPPSDLVLRYGSP